MLAWLGLAVCEKKTSQRNIKKPLIEKWLTHRLTGLLIYKRPEASKPLYVRPEAPKL